eukprot:CAMPEP_0201212782 /NCGR_PEP_ID=MMETSP0851-20130426/184831_1 /ASSEMBLY_ACC=CAM_ASM_000631 /TAXON_ID=183588 /ORGANISM="Pseudo-nitzschia fraudulenta, Strain WWA7" /LENGTH=117 /DNA_ID=CAMNT_0047501877 /DNA_START=47 /DNA_END=397 /DNA_ORIENTATION=-
MANTSDGKGDPLAPPNAHMNTDALPSDSPPVYRGKNDSNPTDIAQDLLNDSLHSPPTRPSDQDRDQSNEDMEFYDTNTDAPDIASYNNAGDSANADADMINNANNTNDNTDANNGNN